MVGGFSCLQEGKILKLKKETHSELTRIEFQVIGFGQSRMRTLPVTSVLSFNQKRNRSNRKKMKNGRSLRFWRISSIEIRLSRLYSSTASFHDIRVEFTLEI